MITQVIEKIRDRNDELASGLNTLGGAVTADLEGLHIRHLLGFLQHKLLPLMHLEEEELYALAEASVGFSPGLFADCRAEHQSVERQIASIAESFKAAPPHAASDRVLQQRLEILLARLESTLKAHRRREESVYRSILEGCTIDASQCELSRRMQQIYGEKDCATLNSPLDNIEGDHHGGFLR